MKNKIKIYTIGHSNREAYHFIKLLKKYNINLLIDVRRFPKSRKFPWFNQETLKKNLKTNGIIYMWLGKNLGGYRKGGYKKYMETPAYQEGILMIKKLANKRRIAIMCSEKLWFKCHRRYISHTLVKEGYQVIHIIDDDKINVHRNLSNIL